MLVQDGYSVGEIKVALGNALYGKPLGKRAQGIVTKALNYSKTDAEEIALANAEHQKVMDADISPQALGYGNTVNAPFSPDNAQPLTLEEQAQPRGADGGVKFSRTKSKVDVDYMDAVNRGDMETAQQLVNEYAASRGYANDAEDTRMMHKAPVNNGDNAPLHDLSSLYGDDIYSRNAYQYFDDGGSASRESIRIMQQLKDKPDAVVTAYRSVPKDVKASNLRVGDWVTLSRKYAEDHGLGMPDGYKIIAEEVPAKFLFSDANSVNELGFDDGQSYAYQNTKNGRKLLDVVTYDDEGNVIPLSKRFDKRNFDTRFSFAGRKAKTANLENLATAQQALADGMDRDEVRQRTGWYQDEADKQWKWEIDDSKAKLKITVLNADEVNEHQSKIESLNNALEGIMSREDLTSVEKQRAKSNADVRLKMLESSAPIKRIEKALTRRVRTVAELLDHPDLLSAYPSVGDIKVAYSDDAIGLKQIEGEYGSYNPETNEIRLNVNLNEKEILSTLMHEIQHAIQQEENFARGGSSSTLSPEQRQAAINEIEQEAMNMGLPSYERKLNDYVTGKITEDEYNDYLWDVASATKEHGMAGYKFELYQRLAGETEARNTETRLTMDAEARKLTAPWSTQDVSSDKQIVRFEGGRAEMAVDSSEISADKNDWRAVRKEVLDKVRERYQGKPEVFQTKDGDSVIVTWSGLKHTLNHGVPTWQDSVIALHINELISNAELNAVEPDKLGRSNPHSAGVYYSNVEIDGVKYRAVMYTRIGAEGEKHYDHTVLVKESQAGQRGGVADESVPTTLPLGLADKNTTTANLTKQAAIDIVNKNRNGKRLLKNGKLKVLGSIDEAPDNVQDQITLSDDNGNIQGFFDQTTDTTYLIADALTADTIDGVLLHEVGIHAWWAKANSDIKAALEKRAMQLLNQGKRFGNEKIKAFYAGVEQRMIDADVQGNAEEAASYIVEEAVNQAKAGKSKLSDSRMIDWVAKNISQSLANFLSDFISSVRASMHRLGLLDTANLTGADLVAIAKRNMREVATSKGVENTQENVGGYAGVLASMASDTPTQAEIAQAQRDLDKQLAIADKLEAEYGYLPAPNGEKSNLNKQQWAQVRTPQFKAWFGDWEVASGRLTKIAVTFAEAREFAKDFQGRELVNKNSGIRSIVSRKNLDKMLSAKAVGKSETASIHATAVANIDNIFERAVLGWSKKDSENDPNIKFIHRFFAPVVVDGKAMLAKITVKETVDELHSNPLYTVEAVTFDEVIRPAVSWVDASAAADGIDLTSNRPAGLIKSIADSVQKYNDAKVSKIVDANGEPLVVYHGTGADFDEFEKSSNGKLGYGYYFTQHASVAGVFANIRAKQGQSSSLIPAYLNIKNPMMVNDDLFNEIDKNKVIENGNDGVILEKNSGLFEVVAYNPNQIKSAIGNVGTFSSKTGKINFSKQGTPIGTGLIAPEWSTADKFIESEVDNMHRMKQMQKMVRNLTGDTSVAVYDADRLRRGRTLGFNHSTNSTIKRVAITCDPFLMSETSADNILAMSIV